MAFAASFGLPTDSTEFVLVYGVRAAFLSVCVAAFLLQRRVEAVSTFAFAAVVMPVGDIALVALAGGGGATLARHVAVGLVLAATGWLLRDRRAAPPRGATARP